MFLTLATQDNIQAACQRIEDAGYKFQKKLTDGKMRNIAFALDPDGYCMLYAPNIGSMSSNANLSQGSRSSAASRSKLPRMSRRQMCQPTS